MGRAYPFCAILYAIKMPSIPPKNAKSILAVEKSESPQSVGT